MAYNDSVKEWLVTNPNAFSIIGSHTRNTSLSSAVAITLPAGANALLVQCTGQNVKYTLDGTTPTSSVGFVMVANASPVIITHVSEDTVLTVIETAASAVLEYQAIRVYHA